MKEKKPLIKRIKNKLKMAMAGLLVGVTITTGSTLLYSNIAYSNYSSDEQIETIAENLDCDLTYARQSLGHYMVMKHNDDEPIYIYIDESLTKEQKVEAIGAIDYVFGVVQKINSKYKYQLVSKSMYDSKESKTRIHVFKDDCITINKLGEDVDVAGKAFNGNNYVSLLAGKNVTKDHWVKFNKDINIEDVKKILIHELLHNFGFGDVHTLLGFKNTDKFYGKTYMQSGGACEKMGIISPNDFKVLVSLYMDKDSNKQEIKKMLKEYESYFYKTFANTCKTKVKTTENIELEYFQIFDNLIVQDIDGFVTKYLYHIIIFEDSFRFLIYDKTTGNELDSTQGEIERINGTIILKDVKLKKGLRPLNKLDSYDGGYEQDLIILSANGKIGWYDIRYNDFRSYGRTDVLTKEMTR